MTIKEALEWITYYAGMAVAGVAIAFLVLLAVDA